MTMTLISPGDCTLKCGKWLWNRDSEFTKWQHPAMWYVALGWYAIEFAQKSAILDFYICFFSILTTSPRSTCHSAPVSEILSKSDHPRQKKMTSCRFSRRRISAILDFKDPIMALYKSVIIIIIILLLLLLLYYSLKSLCTTSYRSSIETIALNSLVVEKIAFFCILVTDRQTDRQTNRWTAPMH